MTDSGLSDGLATALRAALTATALFTAAIGAWLVFVVATVLPARDPAHVPMWTAFAIGFAVYSALTLPLRLAAGRDRRRCPSVVVLSLGAAAFRRYRQPAACLPAGDASRHFEGLPAR